MSLIWSDTSIAECPGCGATVIVGIMALTATCRYDGYYYVDVEKYRGWYMSRESYQSGGQQL